ncbi:hypothetical protein BK730_09310 [Bacillus wiedmannii]|uniref:Uncharacterized protein n=1 Tax=Bacillus wiedmannii TaxID=1890302 RepID=A0A242ZCK3_9BACI|nr:hypothetical protein BK730_09310 [Bacillus wiedmannii]
MQLSKLVQIVENKIFYLSAFLFEIDILSLDYYACEYITFFVVTEMIKLKIKKNMIIYVCISFKKMGEQS